MPKNRPAIVQQTQAGYLVWDADKRTAMAATAGARAGISTMQEELSSKKPGEAMSRSAANAATSKPFKRYATRKTEVSSRAEKPDVTSRGPSTLGEMFRSTLVIMDVCSNG